MKKAVVLTAFIVKGRNNMLEELKQRVLDANLLLPKY